MLLLAFVYNHLPNYSELRIVLKIHIYHFLYSFFNSPYLETAEGKKLPVEHCIDGTDGHGINKDVFSELLYTGINFSTLTKRTFGSTALPEIIRGIDIESIELVGLCTDICVISNALILKAHYPEIPIIVDASCCAGVTPEKHKAALEVMKSCQIDVIGE